MAALQPGRRASDVVSMWFRRLLLSSSALLLLASCQMPAKGTPVFVDMRAGRFWSGEGLLLEVNEDETRCRVAVRDRALVVQKMWVDCTYVHATKVQHRSSAANPSE
jgi:hypothetical protein